MTKDDIMAEIVWESERRNNPFNTVKRPLMDEYDKCQVWFYGIGLFLILLVLLLAFCLAPAEAKQKSNLTRFEQCQVDYLFCAGQIVQQQAAYNAAVLMTHVCSNDDTPVAPYLDLATLPKFEVASVCQAHLGACGYYLVHWKNVAKAKYAEVKVICQ